MARGSKLPLLVVDGYNVLHASDAYLGLVDEVEPGVGQLSLDPFDRARERLLADVASFAEGSYEAVIVYDGASNRSREPRERLSGGVRVVFSRAGNSADSVIEALATEAREAGREVLVATSDATIRSTTFGPGVSYLSSRSLVGEVAAIDAERERDRDLAPHMRMALGDRLSPESLAALDRFIEPNGGRASGKGR